MTDPANIASHLESMADLQPDAPALIHCHPRSHDTCTYRDLNTAADALTGYLLSRNITPGSRVALCLKPGLHFFASTFALFKLNAIPVFIDPGIGLKNFGNCLNHAEPAAFIGTPLAHTLRRLFGWASATNKINITHKDIHHAITQATSHKPQALTQSSVLSPECSAAAILFTSGSTGAPKGVTYTHANFTAQIAALKALYHIQPGEIDLATFPLFGLFGPALGMTTLIPTMNFTRPGFVHPPNIIEPIRQFHATNMFASPALLYRVGQYLAQHNIKLPSLKRVISAGAPVPASTLETFSKALNPETQIFTPYGATESLPVASIGSHEILRDTRHLTDSGNGTCVGKPAPHITLHIIKITDTPIAALTPDLLLPPNQIGEIIVQGPVVTAEYFNNPRANELAKIPDPNPLPLTPDPFFHRMGDTGYLDSAGRLWFTGRKSQRIKLPTGDIHSIPIEAIFNTHPSIFRSALVPVIRNNKTLPVVCLELRPRRKKPTPQDLRTLALAHPATHMIEHFLIYPKPLPVDIRHNAKINREKLAAWADRKVP